MTKKKIKEICKDVYEEHKDEKHYLDCGTDNTFGYMVDKVEKIVFGGWDDDGRELICDLLNEIWFNNR
jgi:hypothetical protein